MPDGRASKSSTAHDPWDPRGVVDHLVPHASPRPGSARRGAGCSPRPSPNPRHLLRDEGEVIVDEVKRHWVAYIRAVLEAFVGLALLVTVPFVASTSPGSCWSWPGSCCHAGWIGAARAPRPVRDHQHAGLPGPRRPPRHLATMPLSRILDITVVKPLHGRVLGFGHFCFESAAQEQGLREIRYVPRPDARDIASSASCNAPACAGLRSAEPSPGHYDGAMTQRPFSRPGSHRPVGAQAPGDQPPPSAGRCRGVPPAGAGGPPRAAAGHGVLRAPTSPRRTSRPPSRRR